MGTLHTVHEGKKCKYLHIDEDGTDWCEIPECISLEKNKDCTNKCNYRHYEH